jgi:peptidoglycan/LPS O-acetylase OafA/YrhL
MGNLFLLQGWFRQLAGINNPSWSISAEAFFYLLFPFVGAYIWRLRRRSAVYVVALIYLFSVLLILLLEKSHLSKNWWYYFPLARTGEFLVGIAVAKVHLELIAVNKNTKFLRRISCFSFFAASICFVGVLVSHVSLTTALPQTVLFVPLHAVMIAALASDPPVIRTLASQPLLVLLGEASYGLYIIHIPLWNLFGEMGLTNKPILYLVFLGTSIVLSVISFKFFETPLRSSILKSTGGKDREGVVSSSIAQ